MGKILISMLQFILAVLLIPVLYTSIQNFVQYFSAYPEVYKEFFLWGVVALVFMHLFICKPLAVYQFGENVISGLFKFASPLDRFFSFIFPFYLISVFLVMYVIMVLFKTSRFDPYFMFFAGFAFAMQMIFVAQEIQEEESSTLKPTYLFSMSLISILNILLLVLLFDLILKKFTFPQFSLAIYNDARGIYDAVFQKIYSIYQTATK